MCWSLAAIDQNEVLAIEWQVSKAVLTSKHTASLTEGVSANRFARLQRLTE